MKTLLQCQISQGLFSREVAVRGEAADGTEFSMFVPNDFVEYDTSAVDSGPVAGLIDVEVLAREGALLLVRLPSQTFDNGPTITVRDSQIEHRVCHQRV